MSGEGIVGRQVQPAAVVDHRAQHGCRDRHGAFFLALAEGAQPPAITLHKKVTHGAADRLTGAQPQIVEQIDDVARPQRLQALAFGARGEGGNDRIDGALGVDSKYPLGGTVGGTGVAPGEAPQLKRRGDEIIGVHQIGGEAFHGSECGALAGVTQAS